MKTARFFASLPYLLAALLLSAPVMAGTHPDYRYQDLVVNDASVIINKSAPKPAITPEFINGWGIAIRPAGAGGHFWVTAKDKSHQYVGDVRASTDETLKALHQDRLATITLPVGGDDKFATSVVFNQGDGFMISQFTPERTAIRAPSKFIFASDGGIISAWTERKTASGEFEWPDHAAEKVNESEAGTQFFGLAMTRKSDQLYAVNFGKNPGIQVYDEDFKRTETRFDQPFDRNKNGRVDPGEYAPFNIHVLNVDGQERVMVAYAMTEACPTEAIKKGDCKKGELHVGEEVKGKGNGRVAEFSPDGKLVAVWKDNGMLNAPWGFEIAPANFGPESGKSLVGNFGDGSITAFDPKTRTATGYLKSGGKPFKLDGLWALQFGNGASLGDANALYVAAGPKDETQGAFGVLRFE